MSTNKPNSNSTPTPQPGTGGQRPAQEDYNVGVGSADYSEHKHRTFDVVNSMPPPPNPRGGGDNNQG